MAFRKPDPKDDQDFDYEQEFSRTAVKNKSSQPDEPDPLDDESVEEEPLTPDPDEEIEVAETEPVPSRGRMVKPELPPMDNQEEEGYNPSPRPTKTFERPANPPVPTEEDTFVSPPPARNSRLEAPMRVSEDEGSEHSLDDLANEPMPSKGVPQEQESRFARNTPEPRRNFNLEGQQESFQNQQRFSPDEDESASPAGFRGTDDEPMTPPENFSPGDQEESSVEQTPPLRQRMPATGIYSSHNKQSFPQDEYAPFNSKYGPNRTGRKSGSWIHVIILALIGVAVIGATVYLLKNQFSTDKTTQEVAQQQEVKPTEQPTPSPTPEAVTRSEYKVRVLNGTGKSGLAGTVMDKLKELGYQEDRVGNASNTKQTVVKVKEGQEALMETLIKDLDPDYDATGEATLKDNDAADAEVILGTDE